MIDRNALSCQRVNPDEPDVARLVDRHFSEMRGQTPPESCHVYPRDALAASHIHLLAVRYKGEAVAIGALELDGTHAELKSMHTAHEYRGQGIARHLLGCVLAEARSLGITQISLETGSGPEHEAARALYTSEGFRECPPFGKYSADPLSVFMTRQC